jgi:hypothetical protein
MWKTHIKAKKKQQLNIKTKQMNWLIGRKSQLSLENKTTNLQSHTKTHMDIWDRTVGMCQAIVILKPIWTYGIELWGCAKP